MCFRTAALCAASPLKGRLFVGSPWRHRRLCRARRLHLHLVQVAVIRASVKNAAHYAGPAVPCAAAFQPQLALVYCFWEGSSF